MHNAQQAWHAYYDRWQTRWGQAQAQAQATPTTHVCECECECDVQSSVTLKWHAQRMHTRIQNVHSSLKRLGNEECVLCWRDTHKAKTKETLLTIEEWKMMHDWKLLEHLTNVIDFDFDTDEHNHMRHWHIDNEGYVHGVPMACLKSWKMMTMSEVMQKVLNKHDMHASGATTLMKMATVNVMKERMDKERVMRVMSKVLKHASWRVWFHRDSNKTNLLQWLLFAQHDADIIHLFMQHFERTLAHTQHEHKHKEPISWANQYRRWRRA